MIEACLCCECDRSPKAANFKSVTEPVDGFVAQRERTVYLPLKDIRSESTSNPVNQMIDVKIRNGKGVSRRVQVS